ncbi:MAG: hypothetical protein IJW78_02080 [Clostridia bacterium]|nr:hypothetical protein [Clostridia bacterium]
MKKTKKITFCGLIAALAVVFMLLSYIPYLTYTAPAIAGVFMMIIALELSPKWAYASYAVSSLLIFLLAENEAKLLYILFFGLYPIAKGNIEGLRRPVLEYIFKFLLFNAAMLLELLASVYLLGIPLESGGFAGIYFYVIFAVVANIFFVVYDIALTRLIMLYMYRLHNRIKKLL